jgi:uroporphyrinogen-III decarboxylase
VAEGRNDVIAEVRKTLGLMTYGSILSPLWSLYIPLGFEGLMGLVGQEPELAARACERVLQNVKQTIRLLAALGLDAVWIEECMTDQISPKAFAALSAPFVRECAAEIRACGLKSIYYYCGDPNDRLDAILDAGADAVHFEESKKAFNIDILEIAERIDGRCALFGNLDAVDVLQNGTEEQLRAEIRRQFEAGKRNGNRFVMSTGSPITPQTPVARVRLYVDLVHEMAR